MSTSAEELRSRLERYRGFLKQDTDNVSLVGEVADLHLRLGETRQARDVLEQALARFPSQPTLVSRLANVAMASGEPDLALRLLNGLIEAGQNDPIIHYNLAYAYLYANQPENANKQLLKIENLATVTPQALLLLARTQHHLGEMDEAIKNTQSYLEKNPDDPEALGLLSLMNLDGDRIDAAREAAEKALAISQDNLNAMITLGSLALSVQDDQQASQYFEKVVSRNPKSGRGWAGMGLTDMLHIDLPKAIEHLTLAVTYMPDHIGTWHALAWCQLLTNDLTGAEASFNRSMEIDRNFGETHGGLAVVHIFQNRIDLAEPEMKRGLRLNPQSFAARFAQSLLVNRTDPQKAQQMLQDMLASPVTPGGEPLKDTITRLSLKRNIAAKH